MKYTITIAAALAVASSALVTARAAEQFDGRSNQEKGESSYIQGTTSGLGQNGVDRVQDIRRTSTGEMQFSQQQVDQIRNAAKQAKLEREASDVNFTISVGAAVPRQAHTHDLPPQLAKTVPTSTPLRYVLTRDRLVLIDKRTERIVAIIPGMG